MIHWCTYSLMQNKLKMIKVHFFLPLLTTKSVVVIVSYSDTALVQCRPSVQSSGLWFQLQAPDGTLYTLCRSVFLCRVSACEAESLSMVHSVDVYPASSWKVVSFLALWWEQFVWLGVTRQILCWNITLRVYVFNIASAVEKPCAARLASPSFPAIDCRPHVFTCSNNNLAQRLRPRDVNMWRGLCVIKGAFGFTFYTECTHMIDFWRVLPGSTAIPGVHTRMWLLDKILLLFHL